MSKSKHIDRICSVIIALLLVFTILFMSGSSWGLQSAQAAMGYESRLFDTSRVHSIDIVMDDWDTFIENCESEEYSACTVVIDGEKCGNIGIRAKGNTSLSNVRQAGSQRYSFKLEFDQYESGKTYYGLDKLCLNNLIQDNTMMKDYLVYRMMADFGADSPLCSYAYLTVNGEDWGLYLAVEGLEDSFLQRSYGSNAGDLYKPDSMSFGGGRGNGRDFNMEDFRKSDDEDTEEEDSSGDGNAEAQGSADTAGQAPDGAGMPSGGADMFPDGAMPGQVPDGFEMPSGGADMFPDGAMSGQAPDGAGMPSGGADMFPDGAMPGQASYGAETAQPGVMPDQSSGKEGMTRGGNRGGGGGFNFGGMGSDDVKLKYSDDDPDSYSNIFNNAKTDVSEADKKRLIASLKSLNEYTDLENVLDMEEVLRYFVVHNFVCNGDSYTGAMVHNYYLHESDGKLGMIPWDYNLAYGTFQGGDASGTINTSIDSPVSNGDVDDRPMVGWIFSDDSYTEEYHRLFSEFVDSWITNGKLSSLVEETADMIRSYVEKDPTKFCTAEEFETGVDTIASYVTLRGEAVTRQLQGDDTPVETGDLNLSDMGSMGGGRGGGGAGMPGGSDFIASMISVKDAEGNDADLKELIGDVSSIASVQLADGTSVDIDSSDPRSLMQIDFDSVVSATDQSGNVTDLSEYTISMNFPSREAREDGSGTAGTGTQAQKTPEESAGTGTQVQGTPEVTDGTAAQDGGTPEGNAGSEFREKTGTEEKDQASGQEGFPGSSSQMQGGFPGGMPDGMPGGPGRMPGTSSASSSKNRMLLVGASFLVLAAGIAIAVGKKKNV